MQKFLSTLSAWRATLYRHIEIRFLHTFLSTLSAWRATRDQVIYFLERFRFLSTLSAWRATCAATAPVVPLPAFLSTLSAWRATSSKNVFPSQAADFYPRSPHGERPDLFSQWYILDWNFYPRSPHGERPLTPQKLSITKPISIHALRMESDDVARYINTEPTTFLSTLSAWRATVSHIGFSPFQIFLSTLSAWRATTNSLYTSGHICDFYPRSPHGERRWFGRPVNATQKFLSTLSAWRATYGRTWIYGRC